MTLFTDHSDLDAMTRVVQANSTRLLTSRFGLGQQFWATPQRPATSTITEVLEISLSTSQLVNWIEFDLSRYPCNVIIEYYDDVAGIWVPMPDQGGGTLDYFQHKCVPHRLPASNSVQGARHPQHSFTGHWEKMSAQTVPTRLQRLRLRLQRINTASVPLDYLGNRTNYSLAVRNLVVGYEVNSLDDVPRTLPSDTAGYAQQFASADDVLASEVSFALKEHDASLLANTGSSDIIWKCEPQPDPQSVVNLYADLRKPDGTARVIDRIFIDPINSGAHCTLYHASTAPVTTFVSPSDPMPAAYPDATGGVTVSPADGLTFPSVVTDTSDSTIFATDAYTLGDLWVIGNPVVTSTSVDGTVTTYTQGTDYTVADDGAGSTTITRLDTGAIPTTSTVVISYQYQAYDSMQIANDFIGWNPGEPWWFGMVIVATVAQENVLTPLPILATDIFTLSWTDFGLSLTTSDLDEVDVSLPWEPQTEVSIIFGFDGTNYFLQTQSSVGADSQSTPASLPPVEDSISTIVLNSDLGRHNVSGTVFRQFALKEATLDDDTAQLFYDHPGYFTVVKDFARNESTHARTNVLWRLAPTSTLVSNSYPWSMFAGRPNKYESMMWTPVSRDYTVQRGWMQFNPIKAKYWKLEFTNLTAEYADVFLPPTRPVKHFPPNVVADYRARVEAASSFSNVGQDIQQSLTGFTAYPDTPSIVSTGGNDTGYTNTEVYIAQDPNTAERLRTLGEQWNYQQWQSTQSAPRFQQHQRHFYVESIVTRTSKIAYTVGLRQISFARTNYSATYDTPQYNEPFFDTTGLTNSTWLWDETYEALSSGASSNAVATSVTYLSNRDMRGAQIATQQSPPKHLIDDYEFDDELHIDWVATGDATLGDIVENSSFGNLLPVSRIGGSGTWLDIEDNFGTWGAMEGVKWADLTSSHGTTSTGADGITTSFEIDQPRGGYLYGAARVLADQDLTAPLWLQLYDTVTNTVLAEAEQAVRKGQIAEWYVTYLIGQGTTNLGQITWGDLEGITSHLQAYSDDFTRTDSTNLNYLKSGQQWGIDTSVGSAPLHIVGNKAQVTAAYPAQCSTVDVGVPWGSLTVILGNLVVNTPALPILKLGGFWLMNDGRVIDSNTARTMMTLTLGATDTLEFDFKPTSTLTSGENPSSVDPTVFGYAIVVKQNTTYRGTVTTARAIDSLRALTGDVGQQFTSFEWEPRVDLPNPPRVAFRHFPNANEASIVTDPTIGGDIMTDIHGQQFTIVGPYTLTYATPTNGERNGVTAPAGQSTMVTTDVISKDGALSGYANAAASSTAVSTWDMLLLDDSGTTRLTVRGNGDLVQAVTGVGSTVLATNRFGAPSGVNGSYTVLMVATSKLSSAFKTAHSITATGSASQTLVFITAGTVQTTFTANNLFTTTRRGIGATDGATALSLSWNPWLGVVSATVGSGRTWDQVSGGNTLTWDQVMASNDVVSANPVGLRCVQKTYTNDVWYMDSMPLFFDPIVLELSNDEGQNFVPATGIRNNPDAVVLFPPKADTGVANKLVYRVSSYAPDAWLSHLVIRPWYRGFMRDMPVQPQQAHGPNLNPQDHYAEIHRDPNWMVWHEPIPREWWFAYRTMLPNIAPTPRKLPMATERISIDV